MNHIHLTAFSLTSVVFVLSAQASADTLLWYRFDGDGTTIENKANPGVMDGTLKSLEGFGNLNRLGDTESKMPVRMDAFTNGVRVIDGATDTLYPQKVKSLRFNGNPSVNSGVVNLPAENITADLKNMKSFTYEAFIKLDPDAKARAADSTQGGSQNMLPIVHWGRDNTEGVMFSVYFNGGKLTPFFRFQAKADETGSTTKAMSVNPSGYDISVDKWHHLAVTISAAGTGDTAMARVYLDYVPLVKSEGQGIGSPYYGVSLLENSNPLMIGANIFATGRTYFGEIAEVRISSGALVVEDFLRPLPPGPVDEDTLLYLPFGTDWFNFERRNVNTTGNTWQNRYTPPLNGAPTVALNPSWEHSAPSAAVNLPSPSTDTMGEIVRGGCVATNVYDDTGSMTFTRDEAGSYNESTGVYNNYRGYCLKIPYSAQVPIADKDFTIEWFFKTDGQVPNIGGNVNPSYSFMQSRWAKIMIVPSGKIKTRLGKVTGSNSLYQDFDTTFRVDDSQWHHYALVYDSVATNAEIWVDYKCTHRIGKTLVEKPMGADAAADFYFGATSPSAQTFSGQLDDLRITQRALGVHEFLTTRPVKADSREGDLFLARLEGDLSSGQDEAFVANGEVRTSVVAAAGELTTATFAPMKRLIDLDGDEAEDVVSEHAVRLDGTTYLHFPQSPVFDNRNFTLEFFAKIDSMGTYANLATIVHDNHFDWNAITGVRFKGDVAGNPTLGCRCTVSADGGATTTSPEQDVSLDFQVADGAWHHWAVTRGFDAAASKMRVTVYRDYESVASYEFDGIVWMVANYGRTLSIGNCSFADNGKGAPITGTFDEIRMRPGVQPVSSFMRRVSGNKATILIFR